MDYIPNRQQWSSNFHIGVLFQEVSNIVSIANLYPGFYSIHDLDRLMEIQEELWENQHLTGNHRFGYIWRSQRARITRAQTRAFYQSMAPLHQARVSILAELLQNRCVPAWLKFEIVTNLPRLVSMEDPDYYQ